MPDVLLKQRLFAEEGLFYQNAWYLPPWQALTREYGGYLNIVANAAGLIARYAVPLRDAPLVSTGIGLLFQTVPALLIVTSRASWLRGPGAMMLSVVAIGAGPATEEVWLQSLHSQNHLALGVGLILSFDDAPGPAVRWFRRAVLGLAPLSGMLAVIMLPLMLARALLDRSRERSLQCGLLAAGALIQLAGFYSPEGAAVLGRSNELRPGFLLYAFFTRHIAVPLIGVTTTTVIVYNLNQSLTTGTLPWWPLALTAVYGATIGLASLRQWRSGALWLLAAGMLVASVSYANAINGAGTLLYPIGAERYSFVPQALLTCTVIAIGSDAAAARLARIATFVAAWIVAVGLLDFTRPTPRYAVGPDWRNEVRLWEADPDHMIRLWPEGWYLQLTRDHSPVWLPVRPPELSNPVPHHDRLD